MRSLTVTPVSPRSAALTRTGAAPSRLLWARQLLTVCLLLLLSGAAAAHDAGDEALPPPPLSVRVIAPSAHGPWLLRIDNTGQESVRLAADIRLLHLTVTPPKKPDARRGPKGTVCDGSKIFGIRRFPIDRELLLAPGQSFVEQFDPRLLCFGKKAKALQPGALVKVRFGWRARKRRGKRMAAAPFVADAAREPRKFRPMRELQAPTMLLSYHTPVHFGSQAPAPTAASKPAPSPGGNGAPEDKPSATDKPTATPPSAKQQSQHHQRRRPHHQHAEDNDALAARLTLTADTFADARKASDIQLSVQAHNTGERALFVALRSRQLSFIVEGPDGLVRCAPQSPGHYIPRDLFRTLHHGKHVHMKVRLREVCPPHTFDRPGLYHVVPRLHLRHNGREYGFNAAIGMVSVRDPGIPGGTHKFSDDVTLVRVTRGHTRFYRRPASSIPTQVAPVP